MLRHDDIIAINRAHEASGWDAALVEVRRRVPLINETAVVTVLDWALALPKSAPVPFTGHQGRAHERNRKVT